MAYIRRLFPEETYQTARNILGRYGLEGHAHTIPIRDLSGGQVRGWWVIGAVEIVISGLCFALCMTECIVMLVGCTCSNVLFFVFDVFYNELQKARVVFVELSLRAPHLLFLDEPVRQPPSALCVSVCVSILSVCEKERRFL